MKAVETLNTIEEHQAPGPQAPPCVMVIFGAAGDLTKRKLIPALYNLAKGNLLSRDFAIVGVSRQELSSVDFQHKLTQDIRTFGNSPVESTMWEWFERRIYYLSGDFGDPETFQRLQDLLSGVDKDHGTQRNYFFYLATAPNFFCEIVQQLGRSGLARQANGRWRRVVIEKPFGRDLDSARSLNRGIQRGP